MFSVRARILIAAAMLTASILVAASVLLMAALDRSLTRSSDTASRAKAAELALLLGDGALPARLGDAGNGVRQVVAADGRVLAASDNVLHRPPITVRRPAGRSPVVFTVRGAPDDNQTEDYRVWARSVPTSRGVATVYVGDSLESVREATATLRHALLVGVPATELVLMMVLWFLVGRALRPVEAIRSEVAEITDRQLHRRVPEPRTDDEVGRLARTMNHMLDRLDRSRRRQREFVADASHELLSPLAVSRTLLEVGPVNGETWKDLAPDLLAENASMERIVRDLLFLARDESTERPMAVPVDLDDVVLEEAARVRSLSAVRIDTTAVSAGPVVGDREELCRTVRNLLENAVRYAASEVRVSLTADGGGVTLEVRDDGPGVDPVVGDLVFERFFRGDSAHSRSGGAGLGLAIARAVAERHGGRLERADSETGARFVLTLPIEATSPSRPTSEIEPTFLAEGGPQVSRPSQVHWGTSRPSGTSSSESG